MGWEEERGALTSGGGSGAATGGGDDFLGPAEVLRSLALLRDSPRLLLQTITFNYSLSQCPLQQTTRPLKNSNRNGVRKELKEQALRKLETLDR